MPSASLEDSSLDHGEETITNAQELSVNTEIVNFLEPQSKIETENGVNGIETIPFPQEIVDSPANVLSLDVAIVSTNEQESADKTISKEKPSVAQKLNREENNSKDVHEKITESDARELFDDENNVFEIDQESENISIVEDFQLKEVVGDSDIPESSFTKNFIADHEHTTKVKTINKVREILSEEVEETGEVPEAILDGEKASELSSDLQFETESVIEVKKIPINHVNKRVVEEGKELCNIQKLALKGNVREEIADLSNFGETEDKEGELLSEEVKNDEIFRQLCIDKEKVRKIVPDTADQIVCITQIKAISFEEDKVSGVITHPLALEDEIVSVLTPELTVKANAVNHVNEVVVEEVKELCNSQDLALKENVCEEEADLSNLEETKYEVREILSEEVKVDKIVQELVVDKEQVSKIVPDIAAETESISQVKVSGDRVFGITHEINLKEGIVRKLTSECVHDLETIKDLIEIPVEKSGQEIHLEKPTGSEPNERTPESVQEVKEDHFEDVTVEHSFDEPPEDKQDVRECTHEDASDIEGVTNVNGEILLEEELHSNSDKTSLQPKCESHSELEKHKTVKDKDVDCSSVRGCSLEEKNDLPDKNPQRVVVSANISEGESSAKDSYQIVSLSSQPSHKLEDATSTERCSLELNASAKEFVPRKVFISESSLRGEDRGPSIMKDSEQTGADKHPKNEGRFNAEAKEYIPSTQVRLCENKTAGNSLSENTSSMFAGEFVPSYVNTNAASHSRFPHQINHASAMRPVYRPAPPRPVPGFRPRGHARMQHRRRAGRFPPNQPRMRFRPRNPPHNVRWPPWSTFD